MSSCVCVVCVWYGYDNYVYACVSNVRRSADAPLVLNPTFVSLIRARLVLYNRLRLGTFYLSTART